MKAAFQALHKKLKSVFEDSKATLTNLVTILLVFGLEEILDKVKIFNCPKRSYCAVATLFIVGPAVCLFCLTLLLHNPFWDAVTGCGCAKSNYRWACKNVAMVAFQALLPSVAWMACVFFDPQYFTCARLGPKEEALKKALNDAAKAEVENKFATAEARSQIIAWSLLIALVIIGTLAVCVRRCCFLRAEGSLPTMHDCEKIEAEAAVAKFKEWMEEEAKKEGEHFVQNMFFKKGKTVVEAAHEGFSKKYPGSTEEGSLPPMHDCEKIEAEAAMAKFKEWMEEEAKKAGEHSVQEMFDEKGKTVVKDIHKRLTEKYPRSTGNLSEPYRAKEKADEPQHTSKHDVTGKPKQSGETSADMFPMKVVSSD